jgi:clusterin-associated protein 1
MASKARLKLSTKKLYASDGRAVQELLKLATLLYRCGTVQQVHTFFRSVNHVIVSFEMLNFRLCFTNNRANRSASTRVEDETLPPPIKVHDIKVARTLASEITQTGAKLFDYLATEAQDRYASGCEIRI